MSRILIQANETTAARRRITFDLRDATDGITPETGEADGQPQISVNGGAWTNTGIAALTHIGSGRYYADLTQSAVASAGDLIETRYKSAATAETPGDSVQIVGFNPAGALSTFDASSDTVDVGAVAGSSVSGADDFKADVSGLSTFDASSDTVDVGAVAGAAVSGVSDFKADVTGLSTFDHETDIVMIAGGGAFWSTSEQQQIRQRLGLDGDKSQPSALGDLPDIKSLVQAGSMR